MNKPFPPLIKSNAFYSENVKTEKEARVATTARPNTSVKAAQRMAAVAGKLLKELQLLPVSF